MKRAILFLLCAASLSWGQFVSVRRVNRILPTAATPTFDPAAGSYSGTQSVTIASTTSGATICYTTNGSDPAASTPGTCSAGSTYSTTVAVAASGTLKALASKTGYANSTVASAAYTIASSQASDTFTGSGNLSAHTSSSGHTWTATKGEIDIVSNQAKGITNDAGYYWALYLSSLTPSSADYSVCAKVISAADTIYLIGRATNADNWYGCGFYGTSWACRKSVSGSEAWIGTQPNATPQANDNVCLVMSGSSISMTVNGTPVSGPGGTDTSISTAGKAGILLRQNAIIDDWKVQ